MDENTPQRLERPSCKALDDILGLATPVLDHGFIRLVDYMGDEAAIAQAARVSYGKGTKAVQEDRGLMRYLLSHRHSTPFEMCEIKLHVKLPIFVARQWIRHRTANVNEYSARYSIMDREFYVPEVQNIAKQSAENKQGRADGTDDMRADEIRQIIRDGANRAFDDYEVLVADEEPEDFGLTRELARINLPLSAYTEWYWKVDLHNLLHFLSLRADPHSQMEIRVYAEAICKIVEAWVPNVWEAFVNYKLESETFSKIEMKLLHKALEALHGGLFLKTSTELSKREVIEFNRKMGFKK